MAQFTVDVGEGVHGTERARRGHVLGRCHLAPSQWGNISEGISRSLTNRGMSMLADAILLDSVVVASKGQISTDLGGEAVILGLESGQYYSLNDVGTRIWDLVQEPKTVLDVRDAILDEYEVEPERCEKELLDILKKMASAGLIEVKGASPS